jgi:hypothetical protein
MIEKLFEFFMGKGNAYPGKILCFMLIAPGEITHGNTADKML